MNDGRMLSMMDDVQQQHQQQVAPTYISLHQQQEQQQHHQAVPAIEQPHYADYYSYPYGAFDCTEDFNRLKEEEDLRLVSANKNLNRPLTTSHHVQQLSSLCPPFSDHESSASDVSTSKDAVSGMSGKVKTSSRNITFLLLYLILIGRTLHRLQHHTFRQPDDDKVRCKRQ